MTEEELYDHIRYIEDEELDDLKREVRTLKEEVQSIREVLNTHPTIRRRLTTLEDSVYALRQRLEHIEEQTRQETALVREVLNTHLAASGSENRV